MNPHSTELFEELWQRYNRIIYWYFHRQFDEHTADDLCQQTYMNAWRYITSYPNTEIHQNKSWLFAVARNVRNDHLRYINLHTMNFSYCNLYEKDIPAENNLDESISIQKAFQKLSEEDRQLLSMTQYLTSKEIGSVLGISGSAVRNRIQKAKQRLSDILREFEIEV